MSERSAAELTAWIRAGRYDIDREFDGHLPPELRGPSQTFWTPIRVAARVAKWHDELGVRTAVDIGSGPGKFCVVGALAGNCVYLGMEHRTHLVLAARALAQVFDLEDRVCFLDASFGDGEAPLADAYYLYNPFEENLFGRDDHLDTTVELSVTRYRADIAAVEKLLGDAPPGTVVTTYNGFGGTIPSDYRELRRATDLPNVLRLLRRD